VAQSYRSIGRHEEAAAADRRALERIEREITVRPDNAYAMMRGAITLAYLGDHERARGCCEESCEPVYWGSIESSLGMGGSLLCCRDRDA
jgi:hypothetical protein